MKSLARVGRFLALGLLALSVQTAVQPGSAAAKVFDPVSFTLDNGLQVVVVVNRRAPIVYHSVWYRVGAADEQAGESGLAHFLEHLMFKGTESLAPGEFSEIIAANGGRENAFTSWDYTAYFQTVAADRLEIMMQHEADRMTNLVLSDAVVNPERDVVREERRSRIDNEPRGQLGEIIRATQFLNHPYRIPIIGWDHEIEELSTEAALRFYKRWYAPNNAILIIAGDVDPVEVRRLAETYYGPIPAGEFPPRQRVAEPPQNAAREVTMSSPRVREPSVSISYLAPSYRQAEGAEAYALQVLSEILGGGATSRLYSRLVVEQATAASAGAGYSPMAYDYTTFDFYGAPRPGGEIEAVEAALRAEIAVLLENGVSEAEVAAAKKRMAASAVFARDNLRTAPRIIGTALTTGGSLEAIEAWPERIEAVTAEEVNAALKKVLRSEQSVTGYLLPKPTT
ncbi:insulinase family protein [Pelagibius litoralis]|uniref:Insulinase family protein n=1 Tax=Pelagibius litoralis TaxID=374515 RepID=A0A967F183_9PROT|nr:pitrilysin family protein [Pelagibius litoralis]NIA71168.1 insulinase family protein [Pelagibius litoralis]